ncbi:glutathionylspermidine synthase family protein [Lyngbya confervoides]|uniref:Glutathionylspermidine synthase family protein n=1 Tax=Lyngbya confervoides BDU141951 TaxID=1574623 RepID=A0ABD4T1A4_9CYAN|nr:glutathionylspermidine synthase family protein [Lyngbya confervoides]MCM1982215.1 glutathionylspermidine synthase family protein [Lyngbya confervoides BDU141951]
MRPLKVIRRPNWQRHIQENAYQADVLSDAKQKYWIEALPQPFAIQFDTQEEQAMAEATERIWDLCVEFLDWFFTDAQEGDVDRRLATLKIRPEYWQAIKNSWDRTEPVEDLSLCTRFDLVVTEDRQIKLIEINGETPLLGAETIYQWNWFVDYKRNHQASQAPLPSDASQFNEFWEMIAGQWRRIVEDYQIKKTGISFLVDENLEEDQEMAMQLIQILQDEVDDQIYVQLVYLRGLQDPQGNVTQRGLGLDEAGYFIDHVNERIPVLWKMYDWSDIQNDMANEGSTEALARRLEAGDVKVIEPLWKQVLSNKGSLAMMWDQFKDSDYRPYLLETYLDSNLSPEATKLILGMHVKKPMLGMEGVGTSIEAGVGALEQRDTLGYGQEGFIIQEYIELPQAFGYHYMVGSWVINDEAAGIVIRGDTSRITGRHCLIIPHLISDDGLYIPEST